MNISCKGDDYCGEFGFALATLSVEFRCSHPTRVQLIALRNVNGRTSGVRNLSEFRWWLLICKDC